MVVIGGAGFLGSHVVRALAARFPPGALDILVAGRTLRPLPAACRFTCGDRRDPAFMAELMSFRPELWFDLAIFAPDEMEELIAAWAKRKTIRSLVGAGSIAEYGLRAGPDLPLVESAPLRGEGAYSRGKSDSWLAASSAFARVGFPIVWGVLPQLWGPGDRHGRDATWVRAVLNDQPVVLRGHGRTLLPDGYAATAAEALVHVGLSAGCAGARLNIAGSQLLTPLSFLRWTAAALGRPLRVVHLPPGDRSGAGGTGDDTFRPVFGDRDVALDLARLSATGFRQATSARSGVALSALWHRDEGQPIGGT